MIRKGYALLLTLTVLISSALAESFTPPAGIDFDLVPSHKQEGNAAVVFCQSGQLR